MNIISQRRKALKLTMKELSDMVGVSESTISRWESGNIKNMKRDKMFLLAQALNISPLELTDLEFDDNGKIKENPIKQEIIGHLENMNDVQLKLINEMCITLLKNYK